MTALVLVGLASTAFNVWQVRDLSDWMSIEHPVDDCDGYDSCSEALTYLELDLEDFKAGMWQPAASVAEMQHNRDKILGIR